MILLLFIFSYSEATNRPNVINNKSFLASSICKKYKCMLIYRDIRIPAYRYNVIDPKTKEVFNTYITSGSVNIVSEEVQKNYIRVDLKPGTLYFSPSIEAFEYLSDLVQWSTGVRLDLKSDLLESIDNVSKEEGDFAPISTGNIGRTPVTFYMRSVPSFSLVNNLIEPKKGHLAYGIVDSVLFSDGLRR